METSVQCTIITDSLKIRHNTTTHLLHYSDLLLLISLSTRRSLLTSPSHAIPQPSHRSILEAAKRPSVSLEYAHFLLSAPHQAVGAWEYINWPFSLRGPTHLEIVKLKLLQIEIVLTWSISQTLKRCESQSNQKTKTNDHHQSPSLPPTQLNRIPTAQFQVRDRLQSQKSRSTRCYHCKKCPWEDTGALIVGVRATHLFLFLSCSPKLFVI